MKITGKKVTVIGLGKSGVAASRLLFNEGAEVSVSEAKDTPLLRQLAKSFEREGISVELGKHTRDRIKGRDLIVTSPGVHPTSLPLQWAKEEGIPILSEIELGFLFCKGRIIAVTGSNGKSTVVTLLGKMLEKGRKKVFVCGNIGNPFCQVTSQVAREDWVVLEVSSFQLEFCHAFRPHIAIILNISPNHLDWHPSFHEYIQAKRRIALFQTEEDTLLLNADDPVTRMLGEELSVRIRYFSREEKVNGVFMKGKEVLSSLHGKEERVSTLENLPIPGSHNEENALSAILAALFVGVKPQAIQEALTTFEGLPHRIEFVGEGRGVRFVNDSKSTTVSSTLRALETLPGSLLLIAGGREKNQDFRPFAKSPLLKKVRRFFLIGEAREKIHAAIGEKVGLVFSSVTLEEAVTQAYQEARAGETVLLSPMCTSFDMFRDFEERGECFKRCVERLLQGKKPSNIKESAHAL